MSSNSDTMRFEKVQELLKEVKLDEKIVKDIYELNNNSNFHPYHNFQHLLTVAIRTTEGAKHYNLSLNEKQALLIAALCHDADYVIGEPESVNLKAAKELLKMVSPASLYEQACKYIDATEFPHNPVETLSEQIIQDADLMQSFESDSEKFLKGLCVEKNDPNCADPRFPGVEGFNTVWAKTIYIENFETSLESVIV